MSSRCGSRAVTVVRGPFPFLPVRRVVSGSPYAHADVGGGSVKNDEVHSLARISLRWMVRECFKTDTGIRFHGESLKGIGLDPATLYPIVQPRPAALKPTKEHRSSRAKAVPDATEEEHEVRDAQTPIVDQLVKARYWWLLEIVPGIMTWYVCASQCPALV